MAPINKNPNMKKQTGTVPKSASSVSSETTAASVTRQSRKNTEIVAPTRRELKEINDYLLSVAEQTKQQNSGGSSTHLDTSCFDLDNFQENQRFCWPVRPIPRRNICNKDIPYNTGIPTAPITNVLPSNFHVNPVISNNNSCGGGSNLNPAAAVGVVIPTTPNTSIEDNYNLNRVNVGSNTNINHQHLNADEANINQQYFDFDNDLSWEQRLKFIQYFLSLTSKSTNKEGVRKMVNDRKENEIFVNSTSLEDVAPNETSETRAQSVTSIHTMSGPATPTYEELQSKLETSSRNIQNIKDQKQQLLKLQQTAKQHLDDMEKVRNQCKGLTPPTQNGSAPPQYESVEQVQSDMANLVNRMKYLTSFIQGQHELSNLLGDDGPEILAEQEALQRKLEELKTQRTEMKNLVSELQEINTAAERSCQMQQEGTPPRVVPIEYQRVVPIELVGAAKSQTHSPIPYHQHNGVHNGLETGSIPEESISDKNEEEITNTITETNDLIQQKVADINAMKGQLKRLKEMMETVRLIEEKTAGKNPKEIGIDDEPIEVEQSGFKNHNQNGGCENYAGEASEEEDLCEKIQILHAVTEDLRSQTETITSERNRLKAIKDEMMRQKQILQQNASQPEESPLRILNNIQTSKEAEKDSLKSEYEAKKKEFEKLCERLNSNDTSRETEMDDEIREPKIERRSENKREQESYYGENWRVPVVSSGSSMRGEKQSTMPLTPSRGKDSADSGAADVHGVASVEAGSLQSGSSRSFSMPPPMRSLNNREPPWRKSSQDNSQSQYENYGHPVPPPPPPAVQSQIWNPYYQHYNMHYAQQFSPHHCYHARDCSFTHHGQGNIGTMANLNANQQVTAQNNSAVAGDPVLLQQFIQTQQMLINSVCQCNQLLWHQQREINNLNNAVLLLQERLLNPTSNHELNSTGTSNRADSLPPSSATVSNNLYPSGNRAQSEQPNHSFPCQATLPPISPGRPILQLYNYNNSLQHHRRNVTNIQQGNHLMSSQAEYNFAAVDQGSSVFGGPNNDTTPTHQQNGNFLNNDIPNSINTNQPHSAAPIFMHHHNNTINSSGLYPNNNSNLLSSHQNCLNTSTPVNVNQDTSGNASSSVLNNSISNAAVAAAAALNNQVPPGNRANNYWDNFRSYSRQNLLSTNSCKSNEDQNHQQLSSSPFGINTPINTNSNGLRNLQHLNETGSGSTSMNNLTQPTFDNKYIHNFRNQINMNTVGGQPQQQSQQTVNVLSGSELDANLSQAPFSSNNLEQSNVSLSQQVNQQPSQPEHLNDELINFNNNNNNSNTVAAIFGSPDFRNMNFNFGANELRKKIPIKTSCNAKRLRQTQSAPLNGSHGNNQRLLSQSSLLGYSNGENIFQQPIQQQINQNLGHIDTDLAEGAVGIDETSDEIKRNLLVNALKNDKFTSKFFESLKEDVYREVYSVILATECHPHYLNQFFKELLLVPTSDPVRNIVMQAIHDLYKRSTTNEMEPVDGYNDLDFPNENNDVNQTNVDSSPIMQNNEDLEEANSSAPDNNRDNEIMHGFLNSPELRRLAYKIMFESSSPTRIEKGKKSSLKYSGVNFPDSKIPNEFYRPDYELVNHIMNTIRSSMRSHNIDDNTMIRVAKLTFSTLENLSSTLGRTKIQIDRSLISPKELYKKMKSFETHNRESFLGRYEAYLQTVFVMKVVNEDANNVNLASRKSRDNAAPPSVMTTSNSLSLSNDEVQLPRRHPQTCKSNIPVVELELNLSGNGGRKNIPHELNAETLSSQTQSSSSHCNQQRNITSRDVALIFSTDQSELHSPMMQEQNSSPCLVDGNIMNEDLAEADQICSSSNSTIEGAAAMMPSGGRGSFTSENLPKRGVSEHTVNDHGTEKEDCDHSIVGAYQDVNRDLQPTSTIDRENLEDGYDGLAYIGFHTDESNSEVIIGSIDNADCNHPTDEIHPILNGPDSACAIVFPIISNDEIGDDSEAYAIPDSTNNNSHSFGDTNSKRNSVP